MELVHQVEPPPEGQRRERTTRLKKGPRGALAVRREKETIAYTSCSREGTKKKPSRTKRKRLE